MQIYRDLVLVLIELINIQFYFHFSLFPLRSFSRFLKTFQLKYFLSNFLKHFYIFTDLSPQFKSSRVFSCVVPKPHKYRSLFLCTSVLSSSFLFLPFFLFCFALDFDPGLGNSALLLVSLSLFAFIMHEQLDPGLCSTLLTTPLLATLLPPLVVRP